MKTFFPERAGATTADCHRKPPGKSATGFTLIFGVTGNTYDAQLEHFAARGADKVFTKPLDIQKLQEAIRSNFKVDKGT